MTAAARMRERGRRLEIENDLANKYNVSWTYHSAIPTDEFDVDRSLNNQARFDQLDEALAETYKEAVERGDAMPAVVAYRPGRAAHPKLVTVDGNHRLVAHIRAGKPIDVYELDRSTKGPTIALMTHALNATHGRPTSPAEKVAAAVYLVENGAKQETAAAAVNLTLAELRKALNKSHADKRATEVGVEPREWENLAQATRNRLWNIATDEGFHAAVHLAYLARLTVPEVMELVQLLNTTKSAGKQRAIVRQETDRHQDRIQDIAGGVTANSGRRAMTPKARVAVVLGQVLALPEDLQSLSHAYAESERAHAAEQLLDASGRLHKLARTLDPNIK